MPADAITTTLELAAFLGTDDSTETHMIIEGLRASAIETICRATGIDWPARKRLGQFNEALRTSVWISYYAVRDPAQNTAFLREYLNGLLCSLQLCGEEATGADI